MQSRSVVAADLDGVVGVDSVGVDPRGVVVAEGSDDSRAARAGGGSIGIINVTRVAGEGAAGVLRLVGLLLDLLPNEVVALVADAGVEVPVVGGVLGALHAGSVDPDVAVLAEAAALVEILVEAAGGPDDGAAGLRVAAVDLAVGTGAAGSVDEVVPEGANALELGVGVDLVEAALDEDAGAVDERVPGTASAGVVLGVVGLVDGAALADVLDDDESGLALADLVDQHLVGSACVDSLAPLGDGVVAVPGRTLPTEPVDPVVALDAVAVERVDVQHFVLVAAVAVVVGTGGDLGGRLASVAVLAVCYGQ